MRRHAATHPGAQLRTPIDVADVLASKPVARPLKLLDCCPISDGAAALVVSADGDAPHAVLLAGAGQAHRHQHLSAMGDVLATGARQSADAALAEAGLGLADIGWLGVYDSFTITLAMLLEEIGFAPRGQAAAAVRAGQFSAGGRWPLNTHGGLLSYGHCGVAGGMAHVVEAWLQLTGQAGERQVSSGQGNSGLAGLPHHALIHADGGVMSAHVSLVLSGCQSSGAGA